MRTARCLAFLGIVLCAASAFAAEFHVSPAGTSKGSGAADSPWNLSTALSGTAPVKPGDTVWLNAGTYRGRLVSRLVGSKGAPIIVRGTLGERVTIDTNPRDEKDSGTFMILGADVVFRDFEVTCSHGVRETKIAGSWPADIKGGSVDVRGDRISLWNLVVHDLSGGFGFWSDGEGG